MDKLGTGESSRDAYFRSWAGSEKKEMIETEELKWFLLSMVLRAEEKAGSSPWDQEEERGENSQAISPSGQVWPWEGQGDLGQRRGLLSLGKERSWSAQRAREEGTSEVRRARTVRIGSGTNMWEDSFRTSVTSRDLKEPLWAQFEWEKSQLSFYF